MAPNWIKVSVKLAQIDLVGHIAREEDDCEKRKLLVEGSLNIPNIGDDVVVDGKEYVVYDRDENCSEPFTGQHYDLLIQLKGSN